jgi:hypothetical protein
VGRKIPDGGDRGTPGSWRELQESFRPRSSDMDRESFQIVDSFLVIAVLDTFAETKPIL